jgi:hypothetical protein
VQALLEVQRRTGSEVAADGTSGPDRQLMAVAIAAAGLLMLLATLLRQAGVPKVDTIWAEDGAVFLDCAYQRSILDCVATPYQGYMHLLPRLGAELAALVAPSQASLVLVLVAALTAAGAGALTARAVGLATGSPLAGIVGGAGLGLVWQAGREVLGNLANAHWVLLTAAVIVLVCAWIGGRLDRFDIGLVAIAGLSSALAPILAILALPGVILRRPGARPVLAVAVVVAFVQVATELGTPREAAGTVPLGLNSVVAALGDIVISTGFFGTVRTPPGWIVPAGIAVVTLIVAEAASRADWRAAVGPIAVIAALVAVGLVVFGASILLNRAVNPRYAYVPAAMMVAALAIGTGLAARALATDTRVGAVRVRRRLAMLLVLAAALVLAVGFGRSFRLDARASSGPDVPREMRAMAAECVAGTEGVTIPISPRPASNDWTVTVPCARLGP